MKRISAKELESVIRLDGPARYRYFVKWVADGSRAWGLWDSGWALLADDDGVECFPMWSAREYAQLLCTDDWQSFSPEEILLDDLLDVVLPKLQSGGTHVAVFPTAGSPSGASSRGVVVPADQLSADLREELTNYGE